MPVLLFSLLASHFKKRLRTFDSSSATSFFFFLNLSRASYSPTQCIKWLKQLIFWQHFYNSKQCIWDKSSLNWCTPVWNHLASQVCPYVPCLLLSLGSKRSIPSLESFLLFKHVYHWLYLSFLIFGFLVFTWWNFQIFNHDLLASSGLNSVFIWSKVGLPLRAFENLTPSFLLAFWICLHCTSDTIHCFLLPLFTLSFHLGWSVIGSDCIWNLPIKPCHWVWRFVLLSYSQYSRQYLPEVRLGDCLTCPSVLGFLCIDIFMSFVIFLFQYTSLNFSEHF